MPQGEDSHSEGDGPSIGFQTSSQVPTRFRWPIGCSETSQDDRPSVHTDFWLSAAMTGNNTPRKVGDKMGYAKVQLLKIRGPFHRRVDG
jgi:hypothetical protein